MKKPPAFFEKQLKRLIIKTHQEIYGKGPNEAWVNINRNVATFYCSQTLTHMEEFLLGMPDGVVEVKRLRKKIINYIKPLLCSQIAVICGIEVLGLTAELCINSKTLFGAILFQHDFDKAEN